MTTILHIWYLSSPLFHNLRNCRAEDEGSVSNEKRNMTFEELIRETGWEKEKDYDWVVSQSDERTTSGLKVSNPLKDWVLEEMELKMSSREGTRPSSFLTWNLIQTLWSEPCHWCSHCHSRHRMSWIFFFVTMTTHAMTTVTVKKKRGRRWHIWRFFNSLSH